MRSPRSRNGSKNVPVDKASTKRSREASAPPNPMEVLENTLAKLSAVIETRRAEIDAEQRGAFTQRYTTGRYQGDGRRRSRRPKPAAQQSSAGTLSTSSRPSLPASSASSINDGSESQSSIATTRVPSSFAFSFKHPIPAAQLTDPRPAHPITTPATDIEPPLASGDRQRAEDSSTKASSAALADIRTDVRRELDDLRSSLRAELRTELLPELHADLLAELRAEQQHMRDALRVQIGAELRAELQAMKEAMRVQLGAELSVTFEPKLRLLRQDTEKRLADLSSEVNAVKEIVNFSLTPVWQHIRAEREEVGRRIGELEESVQREMEDVRNSMVPAWERLREERVEINQKLGDLEDSLLEKLRKVEQTSAGNLAKKNTEMRGAVVQLLQASEARIKRESKAEQKAKLETLQSDLRAEWTEQLQGLKVDNKGALDTYKAEALGELCSAQDQQKAELEKRLEDQMFALEGRLAVVLQKPLHPPKTTTRDTLALLPLDSYRDSHTHFILALLILNRGKEAAVFPPHVFNQHGFDSLLRQWDWTIPAHHAQAAQSQGIDFRRDWEGIRTLAGEYSRQHVEVKSRVLVISWWLYDHLKKDNRYDALVKWFKEVAADKDFTMCLP